MTNIQAAPGTREQGAGSRARKLREAFLEEVASQGLI